MLWWIERYGEPGARGACPAELDGGRSGPSPAELAAENTPLRRENARLLMGRDILRKAALAIVLEPMADDGSLFGSGRPVRFGPLG